MGVQHTGKMVHTSLLTGMAYPDNGSAPVPRCWTWDDSAVSVAQMQPIIKGAGPHYHVKATFNNFGAPNSVASCMDITSAGFGWHSQPYEVLPVDGLNSSWDAAGSNATPIKVYVGTPGDSA